jgi:hypothetical protein
MAMASGRGQPGLVRIAGYCRQALGVGNVAESRPEVKRDPGACRRLARTCPRRASRPLTGPGCMVSVSREDLLVSIGDDWRTTFRPDVPSPARMYNYFLGGKDNYPADREAAEHIIEASPGVLLFARENRAFLHRVVRCLVTGCGIRQFIDIGTGLPADGNVHEVAQAIDPDIRVVYVDHDPVVLAHGRDMLNSVGGTAIIQRDLLEPAAILGDTELRDLIRLEDEPVAVMLLAVVHFVGGDAGPLVTQLLEPLAPGSYLVISHATADRHPDAIPKAAAVQGIYEQTTTSARPRSRDEILALLSGLDIVDPGLVWGPLWRPDPGSRITDDPAAANMYAVVARKPLPADSAVRAKVPVPRGQPIADRAFRDSACYA